MVTQQLPVDFPQVQAAIYRVALSLDSLLLNGIPYGVLDRDVFNDFLQLPANGLLTELASLGQQGRHAPDASQTKVREILAALRAGCQQLIDRVTGLSSFRTQPVQQWRGTISQIALLREGCVQRIQELEACFQTPKPFYQSRPRTSTATVDDFLANLERVVAEEWAAANVDR